MKFKNDLAWVLAMDKIQGDIPDPSSFRPDESEKPKAPTSRGTVRAEASQVEMHAASGSPTSGMSAPGSARTGNSGSMKC